jgi:Flp pilus assembly protein TadB
MSLVMPGYLKDWLATTTGQLLCALAFLLLITGFLWVRKVVRIDV